MNLALRLELLKRFRTQMRAAKSLKIQPSKLSSILHGYAKPSEKELRRLQQALGAEVLRLFLSSRQSKRKKAVEGQV